MRRGILSLAVIVAALCGAGVLSAAHHPATAAAPPITSAPRPRLPRVPPGSLNAMIQVSLIGAGDTGTTDTTTATVMVPDNALDGCALPAVGRPGTYQAWNSPDCASRPGAVPGR